MDCPVDQRRLRRLEIEAHLPAFECGDCRGHWLRFGDYLAWRERQPGDRPETTAATQLTPEVAEPRGSAPRRCPDCGHLLVRYRVGHGVAFALDRCGNCNGVWLDQAEWEALRARGLHDNVHQMFGSGWQYAVRTEDQQRRVVAQFERQLGSTDFARAEEFGAWLADHPRRSEILAYLQACVR
jgi:Zn-finger nucleic acid-binding protein